MNKQLELYFDMDEVLYNLNEYIVIKYNKDFNDNMLPSDNKSYWWTDCRKAPKSYFENLLLQKGVFYNGDPIKDAIETVTKLYNEGFKIKIITLPQYNSDYCVKEKIMWIQKYLPFIDVEKDLIFTGDKSLIAKENRVLVDDNISHLQPWQNENGISIAFSKPWSNNWTGLKANNWKEVYISIHQIQNNLINDNVDNGVNLHNLKFYYENKLHKGED